MLVFATSFFDLFDNLALFGIKIAPAINDWIESNIPAHKQHEIVMRMKHCYRLCKRFHLIPALVLKQIDVLFQDFTQEQKDDVGILILAWLAK